MNEVVKTRGIKELKEAVNLLIDGIERILVEAKDGKEIMAEIKDIDMSEGIELGMLLFQRIPGLLSAFQSEKNG
tara:strand:+ start:3622 stop:3843 length:222 start_codon:yes stop_codon:yes gene_type:complete